MSDWLRSRQYPCLWALSNPYIGGWMVGITKDAIDAWGGVKEITLPEEWHEYRKGDVFATVLGGDGNIHELRMPFDGRSFGRNRVTPDIVNADWKESIADFSRVTYKSDDWEEMEA